jgi:uncharacterized protein (UPF0276 family)
VAGVGLGLRWEFIDELLERGPASIDFVEVSPENYMGRGGYYPAALGRVAERYPVVTHGLTMSLGGIDPIDPRYLEELGAFVRDLKSPWHSDHLCFGSASGTVLHDLLPLGLTEASVARVADRVRRVEDALSLPMAVENISFYMHPGRQEMSEPEFVARVCERAECKLLFDVNNAYVNAQNFGYDVDTWLATVPMDRVVQIHVAGHEHWRDEVSGDALILDTHGAPAPDPVLAFLERTLAKTGNVPVLLERDQNMPPLDDLLAELDRIRAITREVS